MNRINRTSISLVFVFCTMPALSIAMLPGCTRAAVENNDAPAPQQAATPSAELRDDAAASADADDSAAGIADDAQQALADIDPNAIVGPGIAFTPDASWTKQPPASSMRFAQFALTDGEEPAELVVYYFGNTGAGPIDANMNRWIGQIAQPDGSDSRKAATIETRDLNGLKATTIDLTGTYVAETRPGSGERLNKPDWHLLAAIVETEAGPYYFKVTGPTAAVESAREAYEQMLASIMPAPVSDAGNGASHPG